MKIDNPLLSVVIVSWNTKKYTDECLDSIQRYPPKAPIEVIVVDNNSSDGTVEMIKEKYPWVTVCTNTENKGFAGGNNQGWKQSKGRYVLFLNPDTRVHKETFQKLIQFMETHPEAGACAPRLLNPDATDQKLGFYRRTPTLIRALLSHGPVTPFILRIPYFRTKIFEHCNFEQIQKIDQCPGACFFTRASLLKTLGGMDERYKLYFEDVDLAYRIQQAGWKQYFLPDAVITHYGGRSCLQLGHGKRSFLYYQSLIRFYKKFFSIQQVRVMGVVILLRFLYETAVLSFYFLPRKIIQGWGGKDKIFDELKATQQWLKLILDDYETM